MISRFSLGLLLSTVLSTNASICWINTYGRGIGKVRSVNSCPPKFRYDGVSTCDCHNGGKLCSTKGINTGNHCCGAVCDGITFTPSSNPRCPYHYTCPSDAPQLGAPGSPDLCYRRCRNGYSQSGCCICQAERCPNGLRRQGLLCCSTEEECTRKNEELAKDAIKLFTSVLGAEEDPMALVQAATKASCDYAMPVCGGPDTRPPPPLPGKKPVCEFVEKYLEVVGGILKYSDDVADETEAIALPGASNAASNDASSSVGVGLATAGAVGAVVVVSAVVVVAVIIRRNKQLRFDALEEENTPAPAEKENTPALAGAENTPALAEEGQRAAYGGINV